ncbi:MAG: hypothetical protein E7269_04810 [Lachnospiraceae bacterium]|nr:hypothetical protein [Lachnospiraceae bacterium]
MKYMNAKRKYQSLNLQLFASDGEAVGDNGEGSGEEDEGDDEPEDGEEDDLEEKKFSQKDLDDAVKKRLAREKRKWQRNQQKKSDVEDKAGDGEESEESKARKAAESRATKAEARVVCYEAGVAKDSVDDAIALARSYMENNEELDLEDAIEKVVKKYPHFKKGTEESYEEKKSKSWGERQKGSNPQKMSGVEKRFYELNPDLK